MISATAMTEASSNGQIGQPAAWMMANKGYPLEEKSIFCARTLAKPSISGNFEYNPASAKPAPEAPISTKDVDKFVDYR
jgi:hypothetical protein